MPRAIEAPTPSQPDEEKSNFTERVQRLMEKSKRLDAVRFFFRGPHPKMNKEERNAFTAAVKDGTISLPLTSEKARLFLDSFARESATRSGAPKIVATKTEERLDQKYTASGQKIWAPDDDSDGLADPDPHGDGHPSQK